MRAVRGPSWCIKLPDAVPRYTLQQNMKTQETLVKSFASFVVASKGILVLSLAYTLDGFRNLFLLFKVSHWCLCLLGSQGS